MTLEPIRSLYAYNCWANQQVLDAVLELGDEAFAAPRDIPRGGLRGILVHTLAVEWLWRQRCQKGTSPRRFIPGDRFLQAESVRVAWVEEARAMGRFLAGLGDAELHEPVRYTTREGQHREQLLWQVLVHLVNHGTHHRAEAGACLAQLGRDPGELEFLAWLESGRPAGLAGDA